MDVLPPTTKVTSIPPAHGVSLGEAFRVWLRVAALSLRRPGRADRGHAPHPRRGEALGVGEPLPARAQLLHAAAGTRGAAARHLYRLADAPHPRRHHGRRAVHPARHRRHHGLELDLCPLRAGRHRRRPVLRAQGGRARHRPRRGRAHRQEGAEEPRHGRHRRRRLRGDLLSRRAVPAHRARGRPDRLRRRPRRTRLVPGRRRPRFRGRNGGPRQPARRRAARACPPDRRRQLQGLGRVAGAVARPGRRDPGDPRTGQRLRSDRPLLLGHGGGHLRRRLCGARLRGAAGGRELRLAGARRDARRPRHGRDDAGSADHGPAVRRLHGRLPRSRLVEPARWPAPSAGCSPPGSPSRRASCGFSSALPSSSGSAATAP